MYLICGQPQHMNGDTIIKLNDNVENNKKNRDHISYKYLQ